MKFILGKKIGMSQIFVGEGENRRVVPVTVVEAGPCVVTQIKTVEKDGYRAVQVGFGEKKSINKPMAGHLKGLGKFRYLAEFEPEENKEYKVGDKIELDVFNEGDKVKVAGTTKAKGFQGPMKRHGFRGGPASHGQKHSNRKPGSLGSRRTGKVAKGKRMAGRMGANTHTQVSLKVAEVDKERGLLLLKGSVAGNPGSLLKVMSQ